jgi:hypothetical protein
MNSKSPSGLSPGLCYDAIDLLGWGPAVGIMLPKANPGEVVIRVGAWSLKDLCRNAIVTGAGLMWDTNWYENEPWSDCKLQAGIYRLRLPMPGTHRKPLHEQIACLQGSEYVAQTCLVATALVAHLRATGEDLLQDDVTRCAEALVNNRDPYHAAVLVGEGRVRITRAWDLYRGGGIWMTGARPA